MDTTYGYPYLGRLLVVMQYTIELMLTLLCYQNCFSRSNASAARQAVIQCNCHLLMSCFNLHRTTHDHFQQLKQPVNVYFLQLSLLSYSYKLINMLSECVCLDVNRVTQTVTAEQTCNLASTYPLTNSWQQTKNQVGLTYFTGQNTSSRKSGCE